MNYKQEELSQIDAALAAIMKAGIASPGELFRFILDKDADILDFIRTSNGYIEAYSKALLSPESSDSAEVRKGAELRGLSATVSHCIKMIELYRRVQHHAAMNGLQS